MSFLRNVFHPHVDNETSLRRYVVSVTLFAWIVAAAIEVVDQYATFLDWAHTLREFALTTATVLVIAVPVARTIARVYLELHRTRLEAERLSRTDPLTGLANRRVFYGAIEAFPGGALALVIADIDRFKRVNDRYGHIVGDEVIKGVASRMQAELGDLGPVARLGGEEFALVSAGRSAGEIAPRLQQFRQRVADEPVIVAGQPIYVTVSIGFATRTDMDGERLYAAADQALYVAKSAGRDRVIDAAQTRDLPQPDPAELRMAS